MQSKANVLFLSYNGLLEPILPSQSVPYMTELARKNFRFIMFTYEKRRDLDRVGSEKIRAMKDELRSNGIDWSYLTYHKNPPLFSTLFDITAGAAALLRIAQKEKIDIIHVRGITPGCIVLLLSGLIKAKILFDMRGMLAEEYVGGGIWREDSLVFKMVKMAEKRMLTRSDAITVLTRKHYNLNSGLEYLKGRNIPMDVVPCCVDMGRFGYAGRDNSVRSNLGLKDEFVIMYPGKIGTFYFMDEMLAFFEVAASFIPNAVFLILTNDDAATVINKARAMGLDEKRIRIVSGVRYDDMPQYMAIADAGVFFINPYKKIGSSPIKMGEFLASGVPVVINPGVGDTEELVRENRVGALVMNFADKDYADAVRQLLDLKREGDAIKKRCRETAAKHLAMQDGAAKYERIYHALLADGGCNEKDR